jgi:cob(I)alamin adenosyltransferase
MVAGVIDDLVAGVIDDLIALIRKCLKSAQRRMRASMEKVANNLFVMVRMVAQVPPPPVKYTATESKKVFFCGCKLTASQPMCDGSHK